MRLLRSPAIIPKAPLQSQREDIVPEAAPENRRRSLSSRSAATVVEAGAKSKRAGQKRVALLCPAPLQAPRPEFVAPHLLLSGRPHLC